jgi:16S rRNA (guanine527-N7)-methyltransferase
LESTIIKYFPDLTTEQQVRLAAMKDIYEVWNRAINVISRKDFENFYTNHVLHSLAIAKVFSFGSDHSILDVGTGGGFPGIPLAIMFPESRFVLLDSIAKKIKVVNEVISDLGLNNATAVNSRAEGHHEKYSHVVTRAVAPLPLIFSWCRGNVTSGSETAGIIALKGGDLTEELKGFRNRITTWNISDLFEEPFFQTKKIIWIRF